MATKTMSMVWLWFFVFALSRTCIGVGAQEDNFKCYLLPDEVMEKFYDGSFTGYCHPGHLRDRDSGRCAVIRKEGIAMPYVNNCSSAFTCDPCQRKLKVKVDVPCTSMQLQTCKCLDPSMVLRADGKSCYVPRTTPPSTSQFHNASDFPVSVESNVTERPKPTEESSAICNDTHPKSAKSNHPNIKDICISWFAGALTAVVIIVAFHFCLRHRKRNEAKASQSMGQQPRVAGLAVYSAADPIGTDIIRYQMVRGMVLTIVDKRREFIKEDLEKAKEFWGKFPGGLTEDLYKTIEAKSPEHVQQQLDAISEMTDLGDFLLCIVLCHGGEEGIKCVDQHTNCGTMASYLRLEDIHKRFHANRCRALIEKPKIFVFLNCRGSQIARHTTIDQVDSNMSACYSAGNPVFATEDMSDVLLIYGSGPYQRCFFEKDRGSWLLQELCKVADDHPTKDLLAIITGAIGEVKKRCGRDVRTGTSGVQQLPMFTSFLSKQIYLTTNVVDAVDRLSIQETEGNEEDGEDEENRLDRAEGGSDGSYTPLPQSENHMTPNGDTMMV